MGLEDERYKDVDTESVSDIVVFSSTPQRSYSFRSILLGCMASFALAAFVITVVRVPWSPGDSGDYTWTDCGTTATQARERGCNYVPMGRYWAPPECSFDDHGSVEEFNPFQDREWFLDTDLKIPASVARLESGDEVRAFTQYWHDEHCTYMFRDLAMAVMMKRKLVTELVGSVHHFKHCSQTIVGGLKKAYNESFLANDNEITESSLAFMRCIPLGLVIFLIH